MRIATIRLTSLVLFLLAGLAGTSAAQAPVAGSRPNLSAIGLLAEGAHGLAVNTTTVNRRHGGGSPLQFAVGWYCNFFDGYFDNDGKRRDFNGRERLGIYSLGASYILGAFAIAQWATTVRLLARISAATQGFRSDDGQYNESTTGLANFMVGLLLTAAITQTIRARFRLAANIDVGKQNDLGFSPSNGSSAILAMFALRTVIASGLVLGAILNYVYQMEASYRNIFAFGLRGSFPIFATTALAIVAGLNFVYLTESDDGGHVVGAGLHARLNVKRSPFAFVLGGGSTEDYVHYGMLALFGKNQSAFKAVSLRIEYKLGHGGHDEK
jgi:hypothetical protein